MLERILLDNLPLIITFVMGLGFIRKYLVNGVKVLKELVDLLAVVSRALEDSKITKAELQEIKKEAHDIHAVLTSIKEEKTEE